MISIGPQHMKVLGTHIKYMEKNHFAFFLHRPIWPFLFRHQEAKNKRLPLIYSVFLRFQPKGSQRNFSGLYSARLNIKKP